MQYREFRRLRAMPLLRRAAGYAAELLTDRAVRYVAEPLEPRTMLTIVVNGTAGNDTLVLNRIGNDLHITLNGSKSTRGIGNENILHVFGNNGNDAITIQNLHDTDGSSLLMELFGGDGNDTLSVGGGDIENRSSGDVDGGAGSDLVILDDSDSAGNDDYSLSANVEFGGLRLFKQSSGLPWIIMDDDVQTLRLITNEQDNDVTLQDRSNAGIGRYDIETRGGDTMLFERASDGTALIDYDGGSGTDRFSYEEAPNIPLQLSVVLRNSLTRGGATVATWASTQEVDLLLDTFGNDTIEVHEVGNGIAVTVGGGFGDDTISVGDNDLNANILGTLRVEGDGGTDRIIFRDVLATAHDAYALGQLNLTKTGLANPISHSAENITLNANAGNNTIDVSHFNNGFGVSVSGGSGDDTITYGSDGIIGGVDVTLTGNSGDDVLVLNDTLPNAVSQKEYTFAGGLLTHFLGGGSNTITYSSFLTVTLNSAEQDSTFDVQSLGSESTLNLRGGNGDDDLIVALGGFGSTDTIDFAGQGGIDSVTVDDGADDTTLSATYTLTKTSFDKTNFGLLTFSTIQSLDVTTHGGGNTIDIDGVQTGVNTTVRGGFRSDVFHVGDGNIEANISGPLTVIGEQGGDRVIIDDVADATHDIYQIQNNAFTKPGTLFVPITLSVIEHVEVNAGPGNNTFIVHGTGFPLDYTLRGFAGADTFNVAPTARASVVVEGSDPTIAPGDILRFFNAIPAGTATFTPNGPVNGTFSFASALPVTFTGIETFPAIPRVPEVPDLEENDDTGINDTDNVTNKVNGVFTGRAEEGVNVSLRAGNVTLGNGPATGGLYSITTAFPADGVYAVQAFAIDANSGLTGPGAAPLNVVIDRLAPATPANPPDLDFSSDTGFNASDNITRDNTPLFQGNTPANTIVRLFANGSLVGIDTSTPSGVYAINTGTLADGVRNFTLAFEDLAGNVSAQGPGLSVTLDTVAPASPTAAPDLISSSDTGVSNSDNLTNIFGPQFIETAPAGVIVYLLMNGADVAIDTDTAGGIYNMSTGVFTEGTFPFAVRFEDPAGNFGAVSPTLNVTFDFTGPVVTAANLSLSSGHAIQFTFNEHVPSAVGPEDLVVTNTVTNATVPTSSIAAAYQPNTATFTFPGLPGGKFAEGSFIASLVPGGVTDAAGNGSFASNGAFGFLYSPGTPGDDTFDVFTTNSLTAHLRRAGGPDLTMELGDLDQIVIESGNGNDSLVVDRSDNNAVPGRGLLYDGGAGSDSFEFRGSPAAQTVTFGNVIQLTASRTLTPSNVESFAFDGRGGNDVVSVIGRTLTLKNPQQLNSLTLANNALAVLKSGGASLTAVTLGIDDTSTLDLTDNELLVTGMTLAQVNALVARGRDGGTWAGAGITSSNARDDLSNLTCLAVVPAPGGTVRVLYTWAGDANGDEQVTADDFFIIDRGFLARGSFFHEGNFNYNGLINLEDYALIDSVFLALD